MTGHISRQTSRCQPIVLTAAFAAAAVVLSLVPAAAQQVPSQPQARGQNGVREILAQAEAQGTRRTLGGVLGNLDGNSRAGAQTAPRQQATLDIGVGRAAAPPIVLAQATSVPPAGPATQSPSPAARTAPTGTPANPTMIVRVPAGPPSPPDAATPPAEGTAQPTSTPATVAGPPPSSPPAVAAGPEAGARPIDSASPRRVVVAAAAFPPPRRRFVVAGGMCAPRRW